MTDHPQTMMGSSVRAVHSIKRWLPAAALGLAIAVAYASGLHNLVSLGELAEHREGLRAFVDSHLGLSLLIYALVYITLVALSVPGSAVMTLAGGFLFGLWLNVPVTVFAATLGSVIVFQAVKTSLGAALAERAGPLVKKLSEGFAQDAFSYVLFLRLAPVFPFFMVNAVAGLCRVPLRSFLAATIIGIVPACFVFTLLGAGLDGVIAKHMAAERDCLAANGSEACKTALDLGSLVTPELLAAFAGLGLLALLPILLRHLKKSRP